MDFTFVVPVLISFVLSVIMGPIVIPMLRKMKMKQTERVEGGGVSSTEGGDADHGRRDDSGFYCSYLPLLCKGLSEDYSDLVRNAWVWTDRISG